MIIDEDLRVRSCSDEFASIWGRHAKTEEPYLLQEIIPLKTSVLASVREIFQNGKPVTLTGITMPCPYGSCDVEMSIHPIDTKRLFRGATVQLYPTFICEKADRLFGDRHREKIINTTTTLAHGVRNPLNAIKGAVVYIREKYAEEKNLAKFIGIIEEEINRLDTFIAHYLSTCATQKDNERVDVNSILKKIEVLTLFQVQSHGITAVFRYGSVSHVRINPFLMEQAVLNVINNAIEAMVGGGRLRIKTKPVNRAGKHYALVEISDTGGGIVRSSSPLQPPHKKGRGFGLLITYEVLRSVHGYLEISSKAGKGTTVRMYFPCVEG